MFKWDPSKSSQKPLLSIAIPCYNRTEDLRLALQTFADQIEGKYENQVEIIVTDDRSPGPTAEMVSGSVPMMKFAISKSWIIISRNSPPDTLI